MPVPMAVSMSVAMSMGVAMAGLAVMLLRLFLDELGLVGALFVPLMGDPRVWIHEG